MMPRRALGSSCRMMLAKSTYAAPPKLELGGGGLGVDGA